MLTVLFVGRNLFKVLQLSATDGLEGDGSKEKLTKRQMSRRRENKCLMQLDVISLLSFCFPAAPFTSDSLAAIKMLNSLQARAFNLEPLFPRSEHHTPA